MVEFFHLVIAALMLKTEISCTLLDENRCSKFEYEYKILERIIFLENKNVELERKQVTLERKNEEMVEIVKEQRLVMEEKDKKLEESQMELKAGIEETNNNQTDARIQLETEMKKHDEIQASSIEELQRINKAQDEARLQMTKDRQKKDELQDEVVNKLAAAFQIHLEEFRNGSTARTNAVGFTARLAGSHRRYSGGHLIVFDNVLSNVGGGYNPETGVFTAPTDGQYMLSMTLFTHNRYVYVHMMKNNGEIGRVHPDARDSSHPHDTASNTVVVNLSKGDNVYVKFITSGGRWSYDLHNNGFSTFSGVLIR